MSRAGLVGVAATAVVASACSSMVAAYGLPPMDGGADAPFTIDAAYGCPPCMDAAFDATPDAEDAGPSDAGDGG